MRRKSPLKRSKGLPRSPVRRAGKRTKRWAGVRRKLKKVFEAAQITRCELRFAGCTVDNFLTWAHGRKRRLLKAGELESFLCLACQSCHRILDEVMSHEEMADTVLKVIRERK